MLKQTLSDISYARVSTGDTTQMTSLANQIKILSNLKRGDVITHIGSGGSEFPEVLKKKILEEHNKKNDIRINVVGIDRLTRNFKDIDFLMKYARYVYVVEEDRTYDVKHELKNIVMQTVKYIEELNTIRNRCTRQKDKIAGKKRMREELESNNEIEDNNRTRIISIRKRCLSVLNIMREFNIPNLLLEKMEKLVRISQNLNCLGRWYEFYSLINRLGLKENAIEKCYRIYTNKFNNNLTEKLENNISYEIQKKDITKIIIDVLQKNNLSSNSGNIPNTQIIDKFINANIIYGQLVKEDTTKLNIAFNILSNLGLFCQSNNDKEYEIMEELLLWKNSPKRGRMVTTDNAGGRMVTTDHAGGFKLATINICPDTKFDINIRAELRRIFVCNAMSLDLVNHKTLYNAIFTDTCDGIVFIADNSSAEPKFLLSIDNIIDCCKMVCDNANIPFYVVFISENNMSVKNSRAKISRNIKKRDDINNMTLRLAEINGSIKDKCEDMIVWAQKLAENK
jgi:hypothetical protein